MRAVEIRTIAKVTARTVPHHLLLRRVSGPGQRWLCRAHDEPGPWPVADRVRLRRRHLLHRLFHLRGAIKPPARTIRCPQMGPFAMGWMKDHTGSYTGGLLLLAALGFIAMGILLCSATMKRPNALRPRRNKQYHCWLARTVNRSTVALGLSRPTIVPATATRSVSQASPTLECTPPGC